MLSLYLNVDCFHRPVLYNYNSPSSNFKKINVIHVLPVYEWVSSGHSSFLPQSEGMQMKSDGYYT